LAPGLPQEGWPDNRSGFCGLQAPLTPLDPGGCNWLLEKAKKAAAMNCGL
jgi:hypothetical protein